MACHLMTCNTGAAPALPMVESSRGSWLGNSHSLDEQAQHVFSIVPTLFQTTARHLYFSSTIHFSLQSPFRTDTRVIIAATIQISKGEIQAAFQGSSINDRVKTQLEEMRPQSIWAGIDSWSLVPFDKPRASQKELLYKQVWLTAERSVSRTVHHFWHTFGPQQ